MTGSGPPVSFQCSLCRGLKNRGLPDQYHAANHSGRRDRVTLTGRRRQTRRRGRVGTAARTDDWTREYECKDCGHVGWSNHTDLAALEAGRVRALGEVKADVGEALSAMKYALRFYGNQDHYTYGGGDAGPCAVLDDDGETARDALALLKSAEQTTKDAAGRLGLVSRGGRRER